MRPALLSLFLHEFLVLESLWLFIAEAALLVFLILRICSLEEVYLRIALECEDMSRNTVEEPTVMRNYNRTSGKVLKAFLKSTDCIYVNVVGRLVERMPQSFS